MSGSKSAERAADLQHLARRLKRAPAPKACFYELAETLVSGAIYTVACGHCQRRFQVELPKASAHVCTFRCLHCGGRCILAAPGPNNAERLRADQGVPNG